MAIFKMLRKEHKEVKELFKEILNLNKPKGEKFKTLKEKLDTHMKGEEEVVYPELKKRISKDLILEGLEEHHAARMIEKELEKMSGDEENFKSKMKVLKENIEHHIEEEEKEMFPAAEKKFDDDELQEMEEKYKKIN